MPRIHVLPTDLVNQIAAGEVVERPSSVVKELVENAIDAGATTIDILLEQGGRKRIEIRDDGCGMSHDDALLALERHATSKIRVFDDLTRVRTLGFRGEALPSIASVSRFTLTTSDNERGEAVEIECDPLTAARGVRPAARDRGTTISVRELFENVPARRKFLRGADAEFRAIVSVVSSYALPLPSRAFRVEHNGRVVLDLAPAADGRERVLQILGNDAAPHLEEIASEIGAARVSGFVTRGLRYGSRRHQFFFVNGRLVKDRVLTHAANRAAEQFDFEGHPAIVLFLDVPPELVDVNVHPAKTEVRFRDSSQVHVAVEQAIKRALGGAEEGAALLRESAPSPFDMQAPRSGASQTSAAYAPQLFPAQRYDERGPRWTPEFTPLFQKEAIVQPPRAAVEIEDEAPAPQLGDLKGRVIGQYRLSYILIDAPGGLRLVDQHVAHERVLYDRYLSRVEARAPVSQQLLTPILYETGAAECAVLDSHVGELRDVGFDIERFSGNAFAITALPAELLRNDVDSFLHKLIDASSEEKASHVTRVRERIAASLACQAAIKVHRPLSGEEMARVVSELLQSSNPFACPHGRPIIVDIKHLDIERHFHRK
ncbi:MAG: DNA mismatch repair endonuclease MutL [Acidobacteria bacterium]|nr:DNA mismatch repair endonuclease MutL [Acidobacteriota bacterium]MBV9478341.1 DNA mismatch repair endonuclease MutL [Acidobacteriota bacterium]